MSENNSLSTAREILDRKGFLVGDLPARHDDPLWAEIRSEFGLSLGQISALKNFAHKLHNSDAPTFAAPVVSPSYGYPSVQIQPTAGGFIPPAPYREENVGRGSMSSVGSNNGPDRVISEADTLEVRNNSLSSNLFH